METSTIILGIFLFAIATMIIYGWGLMRQKNQSRDLMRMLFAKGESKVRKYLKKNEYITVAEIEKLCDGLQVRQGFSSNRAVVKNKQDYTKELLTYMIKTRQLREENNKYYQIRK